MDIYGDGMYVFGWQMASVAGLCAISRGSNPGVAKSDVQ